MRRLTLWDMHKAAEANGGRCLSVEYGGSQTPLEWECSKAHRWLAVPNSIRQGTWCPTCGRSRTNDARRLSLDEMHNVAATRGGRCLSEHYAGSQERLTWECHAGHLWQAVPNSVRQGTWCPHCAGHLRSSMDDMRRLAADRGGACLSATYVDSQTALEWECGLQHRWKAIPASVTRGSWCPHCVRRGSSYGERVARMIMESMFDASFLKAKPVWLIGHSGRRLELDGYAPKLAIAFEYNGAQHYQETSRHTAAWVAKQKERDEIKALLCRSHDVHLVVIPEFKNHRDLKICIEQTELAVTRAGLSAPKNWVHPRCLRSLDDPLEGVFGESGLAKLRSLASERGGVLLSEKADSTKTKLQWMCSKRHRWLAPASSIRAGTWCPHCAGKARLTLEDLQNIAQSRGGRILSTDYVNVYTRYLWQCAEGHQWTATAGSVNAGGRWCKACSFAAGWRTRRATTHRKSSTSGPETRNNA